MPQMQLGQFIHAVAVIACVKVKAHHHRVIKRGDRQTVLRQHRHIIFEILADLQDAVIFKQWFNPRQSIGERQLIGLFGKHIGTAVLQGHIASLSGRSRQAKTNQPRGYRLQTVGLGIKRH